MTLSWDGSHMDSVWDGFQTELCPPSSHPLDPPPTPSPQWVTQPTALPRTTWGFVFFHHALCWSCEAQGINRPLLGLLNLVVGPGDRWKVWPVPLCHFSLLFWLSRAGWWQSWARQAEGIQGGHCPWTFWILASLSGHLVAPDFRPWITSTNLNKPAAAFSRRLLPNQVTASLPACVRERDARRGRKALGVVLFVFLFLNLKLCSGN